MLTITADRAGVSRRDFLRAGCLGLAGLGAGGLLRARAEQAAAGRAVKDTSIILVWLGGGPSHIDMWDMKPDAPEEVRGEFKPIATDLPGLSICEHLPYTAKQMSKVALVRSVKHGDADHATASHYLLTGYEPTTDQPANEVPSFGSIVARQCGPRTPSLPAYVAVPEAPRNGMAAYLGAAYNPFVVGGDPSQADYSVRDVTLPTGVSLRRLENRRGLLTDLDRFRRDADRDGLMDGLDAFTRKAFEMATSPAALQAFDLAKEDAKTRDLYGRTRFGQSLLLARRLAEAGVTFVTVKDNVGWDTHQNNFETLKNTKLPELDRPWAALVQDLHARGLEKRVLVVMLAEFGRSYFINRDNAGREHWPQCMSVLFSGGGLKTGQVIGASDAKAAYPRDRPLTPEDVIATIYDVLGVDRNVEYVNEAQRPIKVLNGGEPIKELVG